MNLTELLVEVKAQLGFKTEFTVVLLTMALLLSRILPVIVLTPFLGGESVPTEVRLGIAFLLGLVLFPGVIGQMGNLPLTALPFLALLLKEVFIGLSMAFVVNIIFDAASVGGQLMDNMSGTNQAQLMVPQIQQSVSLFAVLKVQLVTTLFLSVNGHHFVINAFADSLSSIPLDGFPRFSSGMWPFFDTIIRVFGDMMRIALAISAPVLLATFLTDLALGMINRVAPQMQVFFVAMQIKPMVTVMVVFTSIHVIINRLLGEYGVMFRWLKQVLYLLA